MDPDQLDQEALLKILGKAEGLERGQPAWKEKAQQVFEGGMDVILGALGIPGPETKANLLGQLLSAGLPIAGVMKAAGGAAKKGIKAFHASPHDFDKFSLSKIGTGEGAQAYGHGLYFAENPAVSGKGGEYHRQFTEQLRRANPVTYPGGEAVNGTLEHRMLLDLKNEGAAAIERWERSIAGNLDYAPDQAALQKSVLDKVRHVDPATINAPEARAYEVSINADPDDFLDWDAPLSQQGDKVQRLLGPNWRMRNEVRPEVSGERAFRKLGSMGPNDLAARMPPGEQTAEAVLKQAGIPGIKYLDGASRSAGQGSRNYVVFDDQLISIVKKYGIAGALSAGLLNQAQAQQLQDQGYK